jgi:tungstate transport system permease protein
VQAVDPNLPVQLRSLGASRRQVAAVTLLEARVGVTAAVVAAYGAIISEVVALMLVGGNIEGETRVLTTAIVLETRKGNFALAMALGMILLGIAFVTNFAFHRLQVRQGVR